MFTHFRSLSTAPDFAYDNSSLCFFLDQVKDLQNQKRDGGALQKRSVLVPSTEHDLSGAIGPASLNISKLTPLPFFCDLFSRFRRPV
jgi:hypothetical protein